MGVWGLGFRVEFRSFGFLDYPKGPSGSIITYTLGDPNVYKIPIILVLGPFGLQGVGGFWGFWVYRFFGFRVLGG